MLTDIFANRYSGVTLTDDIGQPEWRLIIQSFRILSEQVCPWLENGKPTEHSKAFWEDIHSRLSMELGLLELYPATYSYNDGKNYATRTTDNICKIWVLEDFSSTGSADRYLKERLSLIELGFQKREEEIAAMNAKLPAMMKTTKRITQLEKFLGPEHSAHGLVKKNESINRDFQASVNELNTRFHQAGCNLNYHNGFIQISNDTLTEQQIETPFWELASDTKWKNIDIDMKEAVDRRDTGGRDPAFYAARALESAIKIISDDKGLTTEKEIGAHNRIEKLASKKVQFIEKWESEALKHFFSEIRNPTTHGAGSDEIHKLSKEQTNWAIETSMSWIKSLIGRT